MQQSQQNIGAISLRDVLPHARIVRARDIRITSCCHDASQCRPGDLFLAPSAAESSGDQDAACALQRGAVAVLTQQILPLDVPQCVVPDACEAYALVCQQLVDRPADRLKLIGVTGTSGKTTTGMLIRSILQSDRRRVGSTGTLGYYDGLETEPATQTTPNPPQLAAWMARMSANGCSHAVIELSSRVMAQRYAAGIEFLSAVLTNLRRDHIDYHGSVSNYREAKVRLFQQLGPQGFAVINADDPISQELLRELDRPTLTFAMQATADISARVIERHKSEQTFLLVAGNESVPVRTRLIGDHHVYNCLAAVAVGLALNIDLTTVIRGIERVDQVPGRSERLECGQPFGVFVDFARTPQTLAATLRSLRQVTERRLICVYGADARGDSQMRPLLGRVVERIADLGIITSDNPLHEPPLRIAHDILDGYQRPGCAHLIPNREKAIRWALGQAEEGDTVLIAGKGNDTYQLVGDACHHFDDRQIARDWLYDVGAQIDYPTNGNHILKFARHIA